MSNPAPQPYQPAGAVAPAEKTNVLAIVSLVTSILGLSLVGIICGHIAMNQIKQRGEGGRVLALIGLILGYLGLVVTIIWIVIAVAAIASAGTSGY